MWKLVSDLMEEYFLAYAKEKGLENPKFMSFDEDDEELHFTHHYSEGTETVKVTPWEVMGFMYSQTQNKKK